MTEAATFICGQCGEEHPLEQCCMVGEEELCERCAQEETLLCIRCGTRIWREGNAGDTDTPLCQQCYDRFYTSCECCGRLIRNDDVCYEDDDEDYPLCSSCLTRRASGRIIQDYCYKPDPIFYGAGQRFFGVELKIDGAGESAEKAKRFLELANGDGFERLYCKHDGSLDDGLELVTHPMTLFCHRQEMPWRELLAAAARMGYLCHKANTCGLHIHVNRSAFGETEDKQEAAVARVLYFFEKHWEELLKFSRRTQRQLERWAARYGYKEQPRDILEHAKKGYYGGRYACVNLTNRDTIEFRMFRGTLKYNTLMAALQLVDRVCDAALFLSDQEMKELSWTTFAAGCTEPELVQYLKERRLYVNEPVESEVEL